MKHAVINLPDFFNNGQRGDTYIHFYQSQTSTLKNRIVFSQNLICMLLAGYKEIFHMGNHAKIDARNLLLLTAGSVLMSDGPVASGRYESILLFFSNDFLIDFCLRNHFEIPEEKTETSALITPDKDDFLFNYEKSLKLSEPIKDEYRFQKIKIEELLLYLFKKYPDQLNSFVAHALRNSQQTKIKQVVFANIEKGLTIDELAFLCNMSLSTFKRRFSEVFHTSPRQYFIRNKMEKAKKLLQLNKRTSDIYYELGYSSLSSFSSEFKKYFGISPKQFHEEFEPKTTAFESLA